MADAMIETLCGDGSDNDGDGAADCADPDCSGDPACSGGGGGTSCNNNGVCDPGETTADCPGDCPPIAVDSTTSCNHNGNCEAGETSTTCSGDCYCGDSICHSDETATSCPTDCSMDCGNDDCEPDKNENSENCAADCAGLGDVCEGSVTKDCDGSLECVRDRCDSSADKLCCSGYDVVRDSECADPLPRNGEGCICDDDCMYPMECKDNPNGGKICCFTNEDVNNDGECSKLGHGEGPCTDNDDCGGGQMVGWQHPVEYTPLVCTDVPGGDDICCWRYQGINDAGECAYSSRGESCDHHYDCGHQSPEGSTGLYCRDDICCDYQERNVAGSCVQRVDHGGACTSDDECRLPTTNENNYECKPVDGGDDICCYHNEIVVDGQCVMYEP